MKTIISILSITCLIVGFQLSADPNTIPVTNVTGICSCQMDMTNGHVNCTKASSQGVSVTFGIAPGMGNPPPFQPKVTVAPGATAAAPLYNAVSSPNWVALTVPYIKGYYSQNMAYLHNPSSIIYLVARASGSPTGVMAGVFNGDSRCFNVNTCQEANTPECLPWT